MAKSKISESHQLNIEGILDLDTDVIKVEVEEIGVKTLKELVKNFNGANVKISFKLANEITE